MTFQPVADKDDADNNCSSARAISSQRRASKYQEKDLQREKVLLREAAK
jgi:hypothetical protein